MTPRRLLKYADDKEKRSASPTPIMGAAKFVLRVNILHGGTSQKAGIFETVSRSCVDSVYCITPSLYLRAAMFSAVEVWWSFAA